MRTGIKLFPLFILMLLVISGCDNNRVFDDNVQLTGNKWDFSDKKTFTVNISDTISSHNILFNLRINGNYKYSNLFILFTVVTPTGEEDIQQLEFKLAKDDGTWLGSGIGDIYSYRIPVTKGIRFPSKGEYKFIIQQNMRDDMLEDIEDIGVRVETSVKED